MRRETSFREALGRLVFGVCTVILFITVSERIFYALFVFSLKSLGPNPTLMCIPLLFTGFLYPIWLRRYWPHSSLFLDRAVALSFLSLILISIPHQQTVIIAGTLSLICLTPVVVHLLSSLGLEFVSQALAALSVNVMLRAINDSVVLGLTNRGVVIYIALVVCFAVSWMAFRKAASSGSSNSTILLNGVAPAGLLCFFVVQYQLLGSPSAVATLHSSPGSNPIVGPNPHGWWYLLLSIGCQTGILAGYELRVGNWRLVPSYLLAVAIYMASVWSIVYGFVHLLAPLWMFLGQLSSILLIKGCLAGKPLAKVSVGGALMGGTQIAWIVLMLLHSFSTKYTFLPAALWPVLQDKSAFYLILMYSLLPLFAWPRKREVS